jgi:hypothetical protein
MAVSGLLCTASGSRMIEGFGYVLEGSSKGLIKVQFPKICLEVLRKTTENIYQNSRYFSRDSVASPLRQHNRQLTLLDFTGGR